MKAFVRSVCELIENGETFTLASVVHSTGSTPRSSGAKMAVRADGSIFGTIGGGLAEGMACKDGKDMIALGDGTTRFMFVDMTQELAANSDMICGGGLSVLLEVVAPDGPCAQAYKSIDTLLRSGSKCVLLSTYTGEDKASGHVIVTADAVGPEMVMTAFKEAAPVFNKTDAAMALAEPFIPPASVYIYGAGHVSLFTAKVTAMIGMRTVVLDDREEFANTDRFPDVDEVRVIDSFDGCCNNMPIDESSCIIIVTRGHLHDRNVLAEALRTNAGYIGMIGSKKKRDKIYDSLLNDGFTQKDIDRCYCPIGLSIGASTPEEIAVSIGAELIQARSR
ncbi:XdhC family aldehyde oxidoreductase maturation factor [Pseudodesulfovibrio sediminis]|uniref:Xanthine dehydrogenase n=1 Tax=Pseudodesulfovibrio sediminis TaxID=2810563 RepID=A0ABN6ERS1_9BACT|nr:XdhC/CoxI family protein [Pseudodesulfovibrio sediminis]BCS88053.1 xanthine dehydrogenase [Pseudodesulfovibrio sediminis]